MIKYFRILGYTATTGFFPVKLFKGEDKELENKFENYSIAETALNEAVKLTMHHDSFGDLNGKASTKEDLKPLDIEYAIQKFIQIGEETNS